jgi:hypothetical protein
LKLEFDLTQTESGDQLQKDIDTAAQGKRTSILILMQDGQHEGVQQADDLLRLYLDGYACVPAAGDELVDEH